LLGEIGEILARRNAELEERAEERPGDSRRSLHDDQALLVQRIRRFFAL
jgi:hypothetical protein